MARRSAAGRPPSFQARTRFVLYVEAAELRCFQRVAEATGAATTSAWARRRLLEAAAREAPPAPTWLARRIAARAAPARATSPGTQRQRRRRVAGDLGAAGNAGGG
jgi:hypothetical protein